MNQTMKGETISGTVQPSYGNITLSSPKQKDSISIDIFPIYKNDLSPKEFNNGYLYALGGLCDTRWDFTPQTVENSNLNNLPSLRVVGNLVNPQSNTTTPNVICYFLNSSTYTLVINAVTNGNRLIINQILNTLTINDPSTVFSNTTDNWNTYTNSKNNFSVKYDPVSEPKEQSGYELPNSTTNDGQFTEILKINFGTNPLKFPNGFEVRIKKPVSLDYIREELVGHTTDTIDSVSKVTYNNIQWNILRYKVFITTDYAQVVTAITNTDKYAYLITTASADIDKILSTFNFLTQTPPTSKPTIITQYVVPSDWKEIILTNGLSLCLPPKWEYAGLADLVFNRNFNYTPTITTIMEIPYFGGSRRMAYMDYWKNEYPEVSTLVTVEEIDINGNSALTIYAKTSQSYKQAPDGNIAVVWYAHSKLWKAGLANFAAVNSSRDSFLQDFYKVISCSF